MESEDNPPTNAESEIIQDSINTETQQDSIVESANTSTPTERKPDSETAASVVETPSISTPSVSKKLDKINVILKPVGDAPILKQKLWAVDPDKQVFGIIQFIKKYLKITSEGGLFVFVNQAFAPSPDQLIRNLYECFGSDGKLVLHYSTTTAWG